MVVVLAALCLEPLARIPAGEEIRFRAVWATEVAVGLALAPAFAATARRSRVSTDR
jgi:hypothetical protein